MFIANVANADNFSDKLYGRAKLGFGFSAKNINIQGNDDEEGGISGVKKTKPKMIIDFNYNVYYKLNDFVDPFVGVNFRGAIPLNGNSIGKVYENEVNPYSGEVVDTTEYKMGYQEYMSMALNLGAKLKINNNLAVAPYGLVGFSIDKSQVSSPEENFYTADVGFVTGAGVEMILFDRFSIGAEYRYGQTKFSGSTVKVRKNEGLIKFGVFFL